MIPKAIFTFLSLITITLIVANIVVSSKYTTSGIELSKLDQKKQQLLVENKQLEQVLLEQTSIKRLTRLSQEKNFIQPHHLKTIKVPQQPVALNQ